MQSPIWNLHINLYAIIYFSQPGWYLCWGKRIHLLRYHLGILLFSIWFLRFFKCVLWDWMQCPVRVLQRLVELEQQHANLFYIHSYELEFHSYELEFHSYQLISY
jgi:hypothetical protein